MKFLKRWKDRKTVKCFAIQHTLNSEMWWGYYAFDEKKRRRVYTRKQMKNTSLPVWGKWVKIKLKKNRQSTRIL